MKSLKVEISKLKYNKHSKDIIEKKLPLFMDKYFKEFYPNISLWYREKVIEDLKYNLRNVYIVNNDKKDQILGVAITRKSSGKYSNKNPKFCSFYICKEIRNRGFGKKLFEKALMGLQEHSGDRGIIITVPEERIYESWRDRNFKNFLENYEFKEINCKTDRYRKGKYEYIFKK